MGDAVNRHEVAEHIVALNSVEHKKGCSDNDGIFARATKKALRLGEDACAVAKQNRVMLIMVLAVTLKNDAIYWFGKLFSILK